MSDDAQRGRGLGVGRILLTGMSITATGAVLGLIVGAIAEGNAGFWMFVGMGAGAAVAVASLGLRVVRDM